MEREITVYDKIEQYLFTAKEDIPENVLSKAQIEVKDRIMAAVSKLLDDPLTEDSQIVNFLMNGCGGIRDKVSRAQAYRDVTAIRKFVGNIQLASKAWYRYMIVEGAKRNIPIAERNRDAKGVAALLDKIGKYTRADKEDDAFDWSQMLPPVLEPTDDVSVLEGIKPIENLESKRNEFRTLFKKDLAKRAVDTEVSS